MEGSHHSSPATDRPLLPHDDPQSPVSGTGANYPNAEPASNYQSHRVSFGPVNAEHEADIADSGAQSNEKIARISPTRRHGEASPTEEAQALDWIVPVQNGGPPEKRRTVEERLRSTLEVAKAEQAKYAKRAALASLSINVAMFTQIVVNALVTGLSALQGNRSAQIGVSALGAIGTIIASFMVRVRGTREPERSVTHSQSLEKYIRQLEAFIMDEGLSSDPKWDPEVKRFRVDFDKLQTAVHQSENGQPMA